MKTTKGLFLDTAVNDTPPGYLTFAKNVLLTEKLGVIQNEKGFLVHAQLPYPVIGVLPILNRVLYWMTNNNFSEIGYLKDGVYTKVVNDTDLTPVGSFLNFKLEYPIKGEFHITAKNEVVVAWIDDLNTPKIINIDDPSTQARDLELFASADLTTPEVSVIQTGGALKSGVVKIGYFYEDDDGSVSNYSTLSKPVSIIQAPNTAVVKDVWGNAAGTTTNKAISIVIPAPDLNWTYINLFAVKTINQITTVSLFKRITVTAAINTVYTGAENETTLSLNEVLTPKAFYKNAKAITQLNNKLYLGNLTTADDIKLQKFALNIKVQWQSQILPQTSTVKEASGTDHAGFAHGEVYALYLQVRDKTTGLWSRGYHIPGRAWKSGDTTEITPVVSGAGDGYLSGNGSPKFKKFLLDDTVSFILQSEGVVWGEMGYWENENEFYPNTDEFDGSKDYNNVPIPNGRNLKNQRVLHHKFPSINFLKNIPYQSDLNYGKTTLDKLMLKVSNVNFPSDLIPKISAWRIAYAKRDINNATVLGTSGVFFFGIGAGSKKLKPLIANGSANGDSPIYLGTNSGQDYWKGMEYIRFHAFNLMVDKPSIAPTYLRQEIKLKFNSGSSKAASTDPRIITDVDSNDERRWMLFDPNVQIPDILTAKVDDKYKFRAVDFVQYLPTNAIVSENNYTIDNRCGEDCLLLKNKVDGLNTPDMGMGLLTDQVNHIQYQDNKSHSTYLSSLCTLRTNVYSSFLAQSLVATDKEVKFTGNSFTEVIGSNFIFAPDFDITASIPPVFGFGFTLQWSQLSTGVGQGDWVRPGTKTYFQYTTPEDKEVGVPKSKTIYQWNWAFVSAIKFQFDLGFSYTTTTASTTTPPKIFLHWIYSDNTIGFTEELLYTPGSSVITVSGIRNKPDTTSFISGSRYLTSLGISVEVNNSGTLTEAGWVGNSTTVYLESISVKAIDFVATGENEASLIGGGDNWVGYHSIHLQGPLDDNTEVGGTGGNTLGKGCKGVHYMIAEAPKNLNYRYNLLGKNESYFYNSSELGKIVNADWDTKYLGLMDIYQSPVYLYNQDYNTLADLGVNLLPADTELVTQTKFPTTIASSLSQGAESNVVNWKTFLIADRYTMPRNKGELVNLQGVGNQRLFIHHEDSLYITKDRTTLQGNITEVTLGSGNIFDITPFEVLSSDQGYAGTQHKFACVLTKIGYVFPDISQGKIFIHNGDVLQEISKNSLRQFWRDHLVGQIGDNPFASTGVSIAYDEVYNRLIVCVNTPQGYITSSYSPQLEAWCSFHDYDPAGMYATRGNKLYSLKRVNNITTIYQHNVGEYGRYYQAASEAPYPMIAEVVHNENAYDTKHFSALNWITQSTNSSGIEQKTDTWNYITARSATKATGKQAIIPYNRIEDSHDANTRLTEKSWNFNKLRNFAEYSPTDPLTLDFYNNFDLNPAVINTNKDWYEQARLIDNYLVVRFEYSNLNNNKFMFLDHDVDTRISIRA